MLSRNNHHISQMVLDGWATNKEVYVYDLLVPNEKVPLWKKSNIKSVASYDSMYVRLQEGKETDDLEKWFSKEYETPAKEALVRARNGEELSKDDWKCLIDLIACHIVRSPSFIMKTLEVGRNTSTEVLQEIKEEIESSSKEDMKKKPVNSSNTELFPLHIEKKENDNEIEVETIIGKQFYLWYMKHCLENYSKRLQNHKWGILTSHKKISFPTTDNPVVLLNYYGKGEYDLNGKWDSINTNILFPISPNKIIYCQVGNQYAPNMNITKGLSHFLKKVITENAYRIIISQEKDSSIPLLAPREANLETFQEEKRKWSTFQKDYLEKEYKYIK